MQVLMSTVNISEGKNRDIIDKVQAALMAEGNLTLSQVSIDPDHNRTCYSYRGEAKDMLEGTKRLAKTAIELIDMTTHHGEHPRMGAVDVVPFIPVSGITIEEAKVYAVEFGKYVASLGVPVYYYEENSNNPDRKLLTQIRKGEYEGLAEKIIDPKWAPDEGAAVFNAKSGATVTGVRFPLVAFNMYLNTTDMAIGKAIVKRIRQATGGFQYVRAIALFIPEVNQVQISCNLTNYEKTPIYTVLETVKSEASGYGVTVVKSELVGATPLAAMEDVIRFYLRATDFTIDLLYS